MDTNVLFVRNSESGDCNDPWDDTALIHAYEEAFNKVSEELGVSPPKALKGKNWRKGDYCRCKFSEDDVTYEAKIAKVLDGNNCIVKYIGYGNEERVALSNLERSRGSKARKLQTLESQESNQTDLDETSISNMEGSVASSSECVHQLLDDKPNFAPPPPLPSTFNSGGNRDVSQSEAINAMLLSWYMSGYHTGYYEGLKAHQKKK